MLSKIEAVAAEGEAATLTLYPVSGCPHSTSSHRPNRWPPPNGTGRPAEDRGRTLANHRESERSVDHTPHKAHLVVTRLLILGAP